MKNIRIIPRLDIKGPNLVKGIHLEGLRVLGRPENFAEFYYNSGADELMYQDTVASLYGRNSLLDIIEKTAKKVFIPMTIGGGLRNLDDINNVLSAGADKVSINTEALKNPNFIDQASRTFGSSTIVIAIEALKQSDGSYLAFTDNGREYTGKNVLEWVSEAESRGAGEILLTSIDREGTGEGFDLNLVERISNIIKIPLIVHGGASSINHIIEGLKVVDIEGFALASMLHYSTLNFDNELLGNFSGEGNIEFLKKKLSNKNFRDISIDKIKNKIHEKGFCVRKT